MAEAVDVGEPRQVAQGQRLVGEQRARQQGERGVLGTRDGDSALESLAAANDALLPRASLAAARGRASGGGDCVAQGDVRWRPIGALFIIVPQAFGLESRRLG